MTTPTHTLTGKLITMKRTCGTDNDGVDDSSGETQFINLQNLFDQGDEEDEDEEDDDEDEGEEEEEDDEEGDDD